MSEAPKSRRRGLGRGIGALIPDVVSDERPIDVFFTGDGEKKENVSRETKVDPAVGMRQSRTKAKAAKTTPPSKSTVKTTTGTTKKTTATPKKPAGTGAKKTTAASKATVSRETQQDVSRETDLQSVPGAAFGLIPVEQIAPNPRQPRDIFDEDALAELVTSIKEVGVLQPVVVRVVDAKKPSYQLIMGERRFRASQEAGLKEIPAIIRDVRDDDLLRDALLENLHRVDLNPLEEAAAYQQLLEDFNCTQEELSERIGRSRPQISNTLRLLKLPGLVQRRVAAGVLSQGHARALLGLNDAAHMEVLAQRIVAEGLSVRATEEAVILMNRGDDKPVSRETSKPNPELESIARTIGDRLDTRVKISMGKRKGRISVEFADEKDLKRIIDALGM